MPGLRRYCERALGVAGRGAWGCRNVLLVATSLVEMNRPGRRGTRDGVTVLTEELEQRPPLGIS